MCKCTPEIRKPFCGKLGCDWPKPEGTRRNQKKTNSAREVAEQILGVWKINNYTPNHTIDARDIDRLIDYYLSYAIQEERDRAKILEDALEFYAINYSPENIYQEDTELVQVGPLGAPNSVEIKWGRMAREALAKYRGDV